MNESKRIGKYLIEVVEEQYPESPRNWDNLGTMVCFTRSYNLGDDHNYRRDDYGSWTELKNDIIKNENVGVILPLYLYDHSGITMNTTGFSCVWDSGQVGFIFISKEKMLKEYGGKIVTKKLKERVEKYLVGEVETYDQYLRGEVYGYKIYEVITCSEGHEHLTEKDSCWGYYGEEGCMEEGEQVVKNYMERDEKILVVL